MQIWIYAYRETWPSDFEKVKAELSFDLALANVSYLTIEHIGSTAVPGLMGKNIIDTLIVIPAPDFTDGTLQRFRAALTHGQKQGGYYYVGNGGVQARWSFKLHPPGIGNGGPERVTRHVYVAAEGSMPHRNYLALRETLRREPALREEYGAVKLEASKSEYDNVMQYAAKKNDVVRKILRKAGWSEEEIDDKESQAVKDWPSRPVVI